MWKHGCWRVWYLACDQKHIGNGHKQGNTASGKNAVQWRWGRGSGSWVGKIHGGLGGMPVWETGLVSEGSPQKARTGSAQLLYLVFESLWVSKIYIGLLYDNSKAKLCIPGIASSKLSENKCCLRRGGSTVAPGGPLPCSGVRGLTELQRWHL